MTKANKSVKRASIAPETKELVLNPIIVEEVATLVQQISQARQVLQTLGQALDPIVRTAFAQVGIDAKDVVDLQFNPEKKAFTYNLKPKE